VTDSEKTRTVGALERAAATALKGNENNSSLWAHFTFCLLSGRIAAVILVHSLYRGSQFLPPIPL